MVLYTLLSITLLHSTRQRCDHCLKDVTLCSAPQIALVKKRLSQKTFAKNMVTKAEELKSSNEGKLWGKEV